MSLVKIFSTKESRSNKKTNVFLEGKKVVLSWDGDCVSEIEETLLIELLKVDASVQILDKQVQEKVDASLVSPEDVVKLKERITELEIENKKLREEVGKLNDGENDVEVILRQMKLAELKEFAKENKLPEEEWGSFKAKDPFVTYLLDKVEHQ